MTRQECVGKRFIQVSALGENNLLDFTWFRGQYVPRMVYKADERDVGIVFDVIGIGDWPNSVNLQYVADVADQRVGIGCSWVAAQRVGTGCSWDYFKRNFVPFEKGEVKKFARRLLS